MARWRKLTDSDFANLAASRNARWLGAEAVGNNVKTEWECLTCGKRWRTKYRTLQQGSGCPRCAGKERHDAQDFRDLGESKGYRWLGPEVRYVDDKTQWLCPKCEEPFWGSYVYIDQGHGCQSCASRRLKPEQYHALAERLGVLWTAKENPLTNEAQQWKCKTCGREFTASFYQVQSTKGCYLCSKPFEELATPPEAYEALAQQKNCSWLGPPVRNTDTETHWRANTCGHQFAKSFANFKDSVGCPHCSAKRPKTESDYLALATLRGLRCLNPKVASVRMKTSWECLSKGHSIWLSYNEVQQRKGCPTCNKGSRRIPAEDYAGLTNSLNLVRWVGPEVPTRETPTWWECTMMGHRYEDSFKRVKGRHGHCPVCLEQANRHPDEADFASLAASRNAKWLGPAGVSKTDNCGWLCLTCNLHVFASFQAVQQRSGCPAKPCHTPGDYRQLGDKKGYPWLGPPVCLASMQTQWHCQQCDKPFARSYDHLKNGHGCPGCTQILRSRCQDLANRLGLVWLENDPLLLDKPHHWRCNKCGSAFKADFHQVQENKGCPRCNIPAKDLSTPPRVYEALAREKNCAWLGPIVPNMHTKTQWRSNECGHTFWKTFNAFRRNSPCPRCSSRRRKDESDYVALARKRGLRCLKPKVATVRQRTSWRCLKKGHIFWLSYREVQARAGCPICNQGWRRASVEKYSELACSLKLVRWLGPEVSNQHQLTWWQCTSPEAHRYEDTYSRVKGRLGRCPICRRRHGKKQQTAQTDRTARAKARAQKAHPVNRDMNYSREEVDFMQAMEEYVRKTGNRNPTKGEILTVLLAIGFQRSSPLPIGQSPVDEFTAAMDEYRRAGGRLFPTWSQVFAVLRGLGYSKPGNPIAT